MLEVLLILVFLASVIVLAGVALGKKRDREARALRTLHEGTAPTPRSLQIVGKSPEKAQNAKQTSANH